MPGRGWRTGKEKAPPFAARCKQLRSASTLTVEGRGLQRKRKHRGPGNACLDFEPGSFSAFLWFSLNPHKGASTKSPGCSLSIQHPPQNTSKSLKSFFFYHLYPGRSRTQERFCQLQLGCPGWAFLKICLFTVFLKPGSGRLREYQGFLYNGGWVIFTQ